jgi:hypothetical protein
LNEQTSSIFRQDIFSSGRRVQTRLVFDTGLQAHATTAPRDFSRRHRQARVLLLAADASRYLLLLLPILVFVVSTAQEGGIVRFVAVPGTLALARLWEVALRRTVGTVEGLRPVGR